MGKTGGLILPELDVIENGSFSNESKEWKVLKERKKE